MTRASAKSQPCLIVSYVDPTRTMLPSPWTAESLHVRVCSKIEDRKSSRRRVAMVIIIRSGPEGRIRAPIGVVTGHGKLVIAGRRILGQGIPKGLEKAHQDLSAGIEPQVWQQIP